MNGNIPGDGDGGDSTGLSDGDFGVTAAVEHLRELSALAGTGLSDDDDNGVVLYGFDDLFFVLDYGKGCHVPRHNPTTATNFKLLVVLQVKRFN